MTSLKTDALLSSTLELGVPLAIATLQARGAPREHDWDRARDFAWVLGEKGDQILYRGRETATLVAQLIEAIAVMAHCPGGIHVFGVRYIAANALQSEPQPPR